MKFLNQSDVDSFIKDIEISQLELDNLLLKRVDKTDQFFWEFDGIEYFKILELSKRIEKSLINFQECVLWVKSWGVWHSSENLHLYYTMRKMAGDQFHLSDKPGHLFLDFETNELHSYIQISILNGWDFFLFTKPSWTKVFVSHDGWINIDSDMNEEVEKAFANLQSGE